MPSMLKALGPIPSSAKEKIKGYSTSFINHGVWRHITDCNCSIQGAKAVKIANSRLASATY